MLFDMYSSGAVKRGVKPVDAPIAQFINRSTGTSAIGGTYMIDYLVANAISSVEPGSLGDDTSGWAGFVNPFAAGNGKIAAGSFVVAMESAPVGQPCKCLLAGFVDRLAVNAGLSPIAIGDPLYVVFQAVAGGGTVLIPQANIVFGVGNKAVAIAREAYTAGVNGFIKAYFNGAGFGAFYP